MDTTTSYVIVTSGVCWSDRGDAGGWVESGEWATIQARRVATIQRRSIPPDRVPNQKQGKKIEHGSILVYQSGHAVYNRTSVTDTLVESEINIVTSTIRALSKVTFAYPEKSRVKPALNIAFYMCPFAVAPPQFSRRSGGGASW